MKKKIIEIDENNSSTELMLEDKINSSKAKIRNPSKEKINPEEEDSEYIPETQKLTKKRKINSKRETTSKIVDFYDFGFDFENKLKRYFIHFNVFCNYLINNEKIRRVDTNFLESEKFYLSIKNYVKKKKYKKFTLPQLQKSLSKILELEELKEMDQKNLRSSIEYLKELYPPKSTSQSIPKVTLKPSNIKSAPVKKKVGTKNLARKSCGDVKFTPKRKLVDLYSNSEKKEKKIGKKSLKNEKNVGVNFDDENLLKSPIFNSNNTLEKYLDLSIGDDGNLESSFISHQDLLKKQFETDLKSIQLRRKIMKLKFELEENQLISKHLSELGKK